MRQPFTRDFLSKHFLVVISFSLETTNLAYPYLKTCVTVKIWLNLIYRNLISRLIHTTVPVPGGGEWVVLGEKKMFTKNV